MHTYSEERKNSINPINAKFWNTELEHTYMEKTWPVAISRYKILAFLGVPITFLDPNIINNPPASKIIGSVFSALMFMLPVLLKNKKYFRLYHDYATGFIMFLLILSQIVTSFIGRVQQPEEPFFLGLIALLMIIMIFGLMPFGLIAATTTIVVLGATHFGASYILLADVQVPASYFPMTISMYILASIIMFIYHRELEISRRKQFVQLQEINEKKQYIESTFKSYMGGAVGETILSKKIELKGEDRWVTILFTDLQGYSTIIEPMSPKEVLELLNDYFSQMGSIIEKYDGVVLEYIGDAMMVVFGAPNEVKEHQIKAVRCAMEMREHMGKLNQKWIKTGVARFWKNQGIETLTARVGIHTGNIVAGNIGGKNKLKYGAIGDVVNIAARLEQANKSLQTNILFSRSVYVALPEDLIKQAVERGSLPLKGRSNEELVYSV